MDSPVLASMTAPPGQSSSCGRTVIRGIRLEALDLPARERPLDGAVHAPARKGLRRAVDALDSRLDGAMIGARERLAQRLERSEERRVGKGGRPWWGTARRRIGASRRRG